MSVLTYKQILKEYTPVNEGDFFKHFILERGSFIIYSPLDGSVSCVELLNFTDISPQDLALILDFNTFLISDEKEYKIEVTTEKNNILKYLFDIKKLDAETKNYTHAIQPYEGYLLVEPTTSNVRNIYDISDLNKPAFDNAITYLNNNNTKAKEIFITFDPKQYDRLLNDAQTNNEYLIYLLASGSFFLFEKLFDLKKKTNVLIGKENPLDVLKLYVYSLSKSNSNAVNIEYDNIYISISFEKEYFEVEDILNIKNATLKDLRKEHGADLKDLFEMKRTEDKFFLIFRNSQNLIYSLNLILHDAMKINIKQVL